VVTDIAGERARLAAAGLTIERREAWGAVFDYRDARDVDRPATQLFLHVAEALDPAIDTQASERQVMRNIEAIGIERFPSTGISYNAACFDSGRLYEGQPVTRRGAHTVNDEQRATCPIHGGSLAAPSFNLNVTARAIVLPQMVADDVTWSQVDSIARWGAALILAGEVKRGARWCGHRCVSAKSCPGDTGFALIPTIQALTERYVEGGLMTLFIIDASHYQSGLPISGLRAAGFPALILKATEGATFTDPTFAGMLAAGRRAGLLMAAYHFLSGVADLGTQAANTAAVVPADIPVWVDVEGGSTRDQAYVYADALRARGRKVAGVYHGAQPRAGYGWWRAGYLSDPVGSAAAVYASQGGAGAEPWKAGSVRHPDIWQFCQHGRVPGFSGDVDFSAYRGTLAQLAASGWFWVPPGLAPTEVDMPITDAEFAEFKSNSQAGTYAALVNYFERGPVRDIGDGAESPLLRMIQHGALQARGARVASEAAIVAAGQAPDVDVEALAAHLGPILGPMLPDMVTRFDEETLHSISMAVEDEQAKRLSRPPA
jgi:GH25 family lysozyme M1 (1,4-beta-N-acetylmuramidase)